MKVRTSNRLGMMTAAITAMVTVAAAVVMVTTMEVLEEMKIRMAMAMTKKSSD